MKATAKRRVLLIEDDPGIQGLVKVLLNRRGMELDIASDGLAGLELLRQKEYGALLLDLMLPKLNGFEIVRELKMLAPELLKKTVVITAASDATLHSLDRTLVRQVLRKPFAISELTTAVEQCLRPGPDVPVTTDFVPRDTRPSRTRRR